MNSSLVSFRDVMSLIPTSVSVLSCLHHEKVYGCTVSSIVSVNVDNGKEQVIFVLRKKSVIGSKIILNKMFTINILSSEQIHLADRYSREREPEDQQGVDWQILSGLFAQLPNVRAILNCEFSCVYTDHEADIFVAKVISYKGIKDVSALIYNSRKYGVFEKLKID